MVGDSVTDVMSAHAVGITCIGLANRPGKQSLLLEVGAEAVVAMMRDLVTNK